jgi:hypothetical protein
MPSSLDWLAGLPIGAIGPVRIGGMVPQVPREESA